MHWYFFQVNLIQRPCDPEVAGDSGDHIPGHQTCPNRDDREVEHMS